MKAPCLYDPYFSRTKHFRRTFKVSLNDGMISIGQYGMTSSVYRCGLVQCMYEFIVCRVWHRIPDVMINRTVDLGDGSSHNLQNYTI